MFSSRLASLACYWKHPSALSNPSTPCYASNLWMNSNRNPVPVPESNLSWNRPTVTTSRDTMQSCASCCSRETLQPTMSLRFTMAPRDAHKLLEFHKHKLDTLLFPAEWLPDVPRHGEQQFGESGVKQTDSSCLGDLSTFGPQYFTHTNKPVMVLPKPGIFCSWFLDPWTLTQTQQAVSMGGLLLTSAIEDDGSFFTATDVCDKVGTKDYVNPEIVSQKETILPFPSVVNVVSMDTMSGSVSENAGGDFFNERPAELEETSLHESTTQLSSPKLPKLFGTHGPLARLQTVGRASNWLPFHAIHEFARLLSTEHFLLIYVLLVHTMLLWVMRSIVLKAENVY